MSGAQIVFGIARSVPSPNTPTQSSDATNVSGSATQVPHTTVESIIFRKSNPLTTFCKVTSRLSSHYFEPFSSVVPRFEMRFSLARLVKAETMSPYCGILINAGVGNPTVPFAQPLGTGEF